MKHENNASSPILGVDIGRVIIEGDGPDTNFVGGDEASAMRAPSVPGAIESLTHLCHRFNGRVWLVSKCGPKVEARTRRWLDRTRFFQTTGIPYGQLRFCKDRKDKAPICSELGIRLFVDDRLDVLQHMAGVVPHRFHFLALHSPDGIVPVKSWADAEAAIVAALALAA